MPIMPSRRDFLAGASMAAAAAVFGGRRSLADEGPPETTTIRLGYRPTYACVTPESISEELLRAEGFTDIRFVPPSDVNSVAGGEIDFDLDTAAWLVSQVDAGAPITVLAGVHLGCYELFVHEPIRTIRDLKGKKVGIDYLGSSGHLYLTMMVAQVGLDPKSDIEWISNLSDSSVMERFAAGAVDAFLGFPPGAPGIARPQDRSGDPRHGRGCTLVAILLLHGVRQPCLGPRSSGGDQAHPTRHSQDRRLLCRRAGAGRATAGRCRVDRPIRLRAADADRGPVRGVARIRPGGTRCASSRCGSTMSA